MRTDRPPRVVLVERAPGPAVLMARAYIASVAALVLRTPLRWGFFVGAAAVTAWVPAWLAMLDADAPVVAVGVVVGVFVGLATVVAMLVSATLVWSLFYMVRRRLRPSRVWVATRGWFTAVVWAEQVDPSGTLHARFWGAFPGGLGHHAARAFLDHLDEHGITARAYPRTRALESLYARWGFIRDGAVDCRGRPRMVRYPETRTGSE